jgi:hypothetical protein
MQPLICPSCGTENPPSRERCSHCAALLVPSEPAPEAETPAPGEEPKKRRRGFCLVLIIMALCLLATLFAAGAAREGEATPTPPAIAQATAQAEATVTPQPEELFGPFNLRLPDLGAWFERVANNVTNELTGIMGGLGRVAEGIMEGLTGWMR